MVSKFNQAMSKLAVTGQNTMELVDCSETIPEPEPLARMSATYPTGKSFSDVDVICPRPFPELDTR